LKKNLVVIVLAGGISRRLNFQKPFLPFDANQTFIEKIVKEYFDFGCLSIIIVISKEFSNGNIISKLKNSFNVKIVINEHTSLGRFYSIKLGVDQIGKEEYCFFQNVDNPFIDASLLEKLYSKRNIESYVIPVYNGKRGHPVLAGNKMIERIRSENDMNSNLRNILHEYQGVEVITDDNRILANINTPEDYKMFFDVKI